MAGDWIKMRGALVRHPKVIAVSRALLAQSQFREWLTPGGGGSANGKVVSDEALRCVTTALLLCAWSAAREHGQFDDDDLWLEHSRIDDLDEMAGAPGLGEAMQSVDWVVTKEGRLGIFLPNFIEFNVPMTDAEKQASYRKRKRSGNHIVTQSLPTSGNENGQNVTSRVEKSREELTPLPPGFARFWLAWPASERKVAKAECAKRWAKRGLDESADAIIAHVTAMKASEQWQRGFEPAPLTYLNQRRWEDGHTPSSNPGRADEFARVV